MKLVLIAAAMAAAASATPALSKPKGHCPPGLAKKAMPCVPPGQAKKGLAVDSDRYVYRRGDYYRDDDRYRRLRDYDRYGLKQPRDGEVYYGGGNIVYRVDRETRQILDLIRLVDDIIGN